MEPYNLFLPLFINHRLVSYTLACTNSCRHPAAGASSTVFLSFIFPLTGHMAPTSQTDPSVCPSLTLSVYCNTFTTNFTINVILKVILCFIFYACSPPLFLSPTRSFLIYVIIKFFQPCALFILFQSCLCQLFFPSTFMICDCPLPSFHCCLFPLHRALFSAAVQNQARTSCQT